MKVRFLVIGAFCGAAMALSACSQSAPGTTSFEPAAAPRFASAVSRAAPYGTIGHVVVIMQENRSFDNLFHGYPGADTVNTGRGHDGKVYRLAALSMTDAQDVNHSHLQFLQDYAEGKNSGFDLELQGFKTYCAGTSCGANTCPYKDTLNHPQCWTYVDGGPQSLAYSYVPKSEVVPYWTLAQNYALGDRTFESNNGPSFPSHLFMISGQSNHDAENPQFPVTPQAVWGCDSEAGAYTISLHPGAASPPAFPVKFGHEVDAGNPCYTYQTIAPLLDAAHVTWSYYAPNIGGNQGGAWSAFDAIWPVRFGTDWLQNVKSPETRVLLDIANGTLPQVSWVVPSYVNSDHASSGSATGPQWVATVVNAIGNSQYWNDTAIVIMWDDWGGWYDHVVPQQYANASGVYDGLGFRVPALVVSPYARHGYVSHQPHEIASTLHLIEETFGLPSLGVADARADAFDDMFDFSQSPAPFVPIPTTMTRADFLRQKPSLKPPDD